MFRTASRHDLPSLAELLNRANEAPYEIARVAEEKLFGDGVSGEPEVRVSDDFSGLSVTCGKYLRLLAVDPTRRRRGIGSALLRDAEARGTSVVAAEPGNYFTPGIVESDSATINFFRKRGYKQTATTQNLVAAATGDRRPATVKSDRRKQVLEFVERHFGA